ncbi:bifunctional folylpolyglutamate synthase/dihydrofolate synthase [Alicyclobacillus cellulosilyticus]|uniref:tetrahydrofolate synthase n=1 Tax=Alicyclobacillus cellulosilyticus TaxID=1003997 RepID=A0A917K3G5_9BACL|nr:folylpolyglutamate synthase/dihydrofolate synthase family protein [Alicyclobacillus cellulosilyticus]GGI96300.1 bifunctional folylpolyglutamate synthase/dihydrofolate synthase [Alicyclobacillus cellulosilyticus]
MNARQVHPAVAWLSSRQRFGVRPGLERMKRILAYLGHPETGLRFYHVAGTNGKGSVCAFLTAILRATGGRVGTFTSPAFDGFRGRFLVDGEPVDDATFAALAEQVMAASRAADAPDDPLTEFEALTTMAILYFRAAGVDHVVWETGLGGRYDSTNVVSPAVTAITNVTYDHMDVLGRTIPEIAWHKAGIIKPGVPVVTAAQDSAYLVMERIAREVAAPVWRLGEVFGYAREAVAWPLQFIHYRGRCRDVFGVPVPLFGAHQCANAAVALAMYEAAVAGGHCPPLSDARLRQALRHTEWPGRFEVHMLADGRLLVLDGAHNAAGAFALRRGLEELASQLRFDGRGWIMVIGVLQDKALLPMLDMLLPLAASVICTQPDNPRALNARDLARWVRQRQPAARVDVAVPVADALSLALARAGEAPVCCWGSLYTVDEARQAMRHGQTEFAEKGR